MPNEVTLSVRTQLMKIVEELDKISGKAREVSGNLKDAGKNVGDNLTEQTKKTTTFLEDLSNVGRRVSDQLKDDFKALASLNAVAGALKLSEQFKGSLKETADLSDMVRKLGITFGIARSEFTNFQTSLTKGLGEIGLSSDVASKTMEGLATSGTQVKGEASILGYSKTAGQLASVTRQQGQEGNISALIAQTIQARGGNVNDMKQVAHVAEDVRRVFNATGQGAQETLGKMKEIFSGMSKDFREKITSRGLASLAAASTVAGPQSTKFIEEFLAKSPIQRKALEAQGMKGVFTEEGLDVNKFKKASKAILDRIGLDPRMAAQTLGLSEDAAEGFVRLAQSLDQVGKIQESVNKTTGDLNTQYKDSMGLGESFRANINQVKKAFAAPLSAITGGLTNVLSKTSQSGLGAAAVVGGGGVLASLLAGGGLRGLGKAVGIGGGLGGLAKAGAIEAATGRQVQPVYVTNASEIGGGALGGGGGLAGAAAAGGGLLGKAGKFLGAAGGVAAAGGAGYAVGSAINEIPGVSDAIVKGFEKIAGLFGKGQMSDEEIFAKGAAQFKQQKVLVELNKRELKESKQPTRGASN